MEKAILVGLCLGSERDFEHSKEELAELAAACELEVVGEITQHAAAVNKAFYIGTGKVEQVFLLSEETKADLIILIMHFLRCSFAICSRNYICRSWTGQR